jgi:hypothetical protein
LNFTTFFALLFFGLPVCGLRHLLAARFDAENEPNPTCDTRSLFFSAFAVFAVKKSSALEAPDMEITASFAIVVIKSCLFIAATGAVGKDDRTDSEACGDKRLKRKSDHTDFPLFEFGTSAVAYDINITRTI